MDEEKLAAAFTEWERQYREDPDAFMAEEKQRALTIDDYGHRAARTLVRILGELDAR